jgi:hypothetical protein
VEHSGCVAGWCACATGMAFLIGIAALSIGTLLSLTQAECRFRRIPARYSDLKPAGVPI